jgi:tRNA A-37 threonylcarbamoyl transferase component Bud32
MACSVKYLSSAGIQYREVKGVDALAKQFPINWLLYASLNAFPKNSSPIEIDLFVVMDDRVVLLELKDWNGPITTKGDLWVHAGKRERSPVVLGNEKAKKIKGILKSRIPSLSKIYVDSRVVLTGTSTRDLLPASEKPYVLTLEEAKLLGDKKERNRLLGQVTLSTVKPNMLVKDFEKLFGNGSYFQPRKMTWDGYAVTDEDFYVHRGDIWREHRVQLAREERVKGLLRLWRFDKLPVGLNEPGGRRLIADRELRAIAYLGDRASWMSERGILKQVGAPPDEVLTEHYQVLSVPPGWTTLRRYLARNGAELSSEHRVDLAHTMASMIAELHSHDLAHRDIGADAVWVGSPTSMALTGFFSATIPDDVSVADYLGVLGTYSEPEPDWGSVVPTGKERDVRSVGLLMRELAALEGESNSLPSGWIEVADKALSVPGQRFANGRGLAEALGELKTPSGPQIDQSRLDEFQTDVIPYVQFPPTGQTTNGQHSTRYESVAGQKRTLVKVWNGLLRGDAHRDHALLAMLEEAVALKAVPLAGVAPVVASGLSPVGPYLVTEWVDGAPLDEYVAPNEEDLLNVLANLVSAVDALHTRGFGHGDLHPTNVIVGDDNRVCLIDALDISLVGPGRLGSPAWAPKDRERCSTQQIDRFAVCKMVMTFANTLDTPASSRLLGIATAEMERRPIETLDPIAEAIVDALHELREEPIPTFRIAGPVHAEISLNTDDGKLWVKRYRPSDELEVFWITGLNKRLLVRMRDGNVEAVELGDAALVELGRGTSVAMNVSIQRGDHHGGVAALIGFLQGHVDAEPATAEEAQKEVPDWEGEDEIDDFDASAELAEGELVAAESTGLLDVRRMWMRAAEIEEDTVLQVRLDRRLADEGQSAVYEYETPRPLEFEDEDVVEVRQGGVQGRRVGQLDVTRCDTKQIAIRNQKFSVAEGEYVSLIDRRDRVSKERRRRAVERITRNASVIPDLIDYFDPNANVPDVAYDVTIAESDLAEYRLNEGQQGAFQELLKTGPVGLLQGPPGSGKTRFIASFVHWLLTQGGARRVLVASQSHEAVNNVLEEVLKTYRARGGSADLLRVGSRGATERVRPYQARTLRERYRVRFENGIKTRVAHAAAAAGIPRSFVHDVVDVDQRLVSVHRSIRLVRLAAEADLARDERRRLETRLRKLEQAFLREAENVLGQAADPGDDVDFDSVVEAAFRAVSAAHPRTSPSDLSKTRQLVALANDWRDTLGTGHRNFDEFLAKTRQVVAGTCVGLGQSQIRLEQGVFDWVIVDEAARCTSGELAVPLQLGSRVLLVGDQRQLRPMVDRAVQEGLREEFGRLGKALAQSDFERAFASSYGRRNARVLDEQYRMTPVISDLVSDVFYAPHGVRLKSSPDRIADAVFSDLPPDLAQPVVWLDTSLLPGAIERDRNNHRDIWNEAEIQTVISLLHRLSKEGALVEELAKRGDPTIGVICMYSEQKRRIEREWVQQPFPEAFRRMVVIDTVDAYQGKENSIVIVTLVRANDQKKPGHVGRENRCNVAMSRAKERLYIVGNSEMWSSAKCKSPMGDVLTRIKHMNQIDGCIRDAAELNS